MAANRIMRASAVRRAPLALVALALALATLAGCGGGSGGRATAPVDKEGDATTLNAILSRQTAVADAYAAALPALHGRLRDLARRFRTQEEEHIDGILKALRGLGQSPAPEPEAIEAKGRRSAAEFAQLFYEMESATIEAEISAVNQLTSPAPRALLVSTAANQAQHLVLLRQALGAPPGQWVPSAFEAGDTPAP